MSTNCVGFWAYRKLRTFITKMKGAGENTPFPAWLHACLAACPSSGPVAHVTALIASLCLYRKAIVRVVVMILPLGSRLFLVEVYYNRLTG